MTMFRPVSALALALGLAACGTSPPLRYHTLVGAVAGSEVSAPTGAAVLVEVLPVVIPERINREEIVVFGADRALDLRENERWAAPLDDEIRQIVDDALWRRLHAADVYAAPIPSGSGGPQYRLAVRVERLDAIAGQTAVVEGSWTARRLPQGKVAVCRAAFTTRPAGPTTEASVAALADGAARLAEAIADSIGRLDQGGGDPCGGG